jgi:protein-disulfide isomerase
MNQRIKVGFDVASTLLVVVVAGLVLYRLYASTPVLSGGKPLTESVDGLVLPLSTLTNVRGTGRMYLLELSDFECPFCAAHHKNAGARIKSDLVAKGVVKHAFLHFPLANHARAHKAAQAAECAGRQGRFWEMYDSLFSDPRALELEDLNGRSRQLKLNVETFNTCLESGAAAAAVDDAAAEGRRLGVNATPTFFVGVERDPGVIELRRRINGLTEFRTFAAALSGLTDR